MFAGAPPTAEVSPHYDTLGKFSKIVPQDAKQLKDQQLDGKDVHVFSVAKCELFNAAGDGNMKVWVDPASNLPLKIRIEQNNDVTFFDNFAWNKPLKPRLFELKAPDGYQVKQGLPE